MKTSDSRESVNSAMQNKLRLDPRARVLADSKIKPSSSTDQFLPKSASQGQLPKSASQNFPRSTSNDLVIEINQNDIMGVITVTLPDKTQVSFNFTSKTTAKARS